MQIENLTAVDIFCLHHNIEVSFVNSLQKTGLIEITIINEINYVDAAQLQKLEKIILFYYELDINLEGIETVNNLLQKIYFMQNEIIALRNRLHLYETNE